MKGDFTRSTFQSEKHYTSVRMQQGRLQLDSDWNEQVDIEAYLRHAQSVDMIGAASGVPTSGGDSEQPYRDSFKISITPDGSDLAIAPGRLYANGTLCELEATPLEGTFTASNRIQVNTLIADGRQLDKSQWIEIAPENNPDFKASVQIADINNQTLEITLNFPSDEIKKDVEEIQQKSQKLQLRRVITYNTQPDYLNAEEALKKDTIYLAYVDVWQRHITAIEDPTIREVALNGSDTTTRTKTIWQFKLKNFDELINEVVGKAEYQLHKAFQDNKQLNNLNDPNWESLIQQVWGKFINQQEQRQVLMNACAKLCSSSSSQSNKSGYQRLENLLYRVEIYEPSQTEQGENKGNNETNKATFKWSRDNGSIVSPIERIEGNIITIRKSSQDAWMSSRSGQWLEITNEEMELKGQPGVMVPLSRAFDTKIEFNESRIVNGPIPNNPSKVRLWSQEVKNAPNGVIPIADDWIELETGIKVRFYKDSVYRTGDYWLIPARNATNDIEWPHNQAETQKRQPLPQPPKGIHHDYCPLALIQFDGQVKGEEEKPEEEEQESKTLRDLRIIFPPLMRCLDTVGGIISGTLEVQSGLYVTSRYDKSEKRYITGKLGVGTKKPLARLHVQSPTPISAKGKISSQGSTVTGSGETFERLGIGDAIIIRDSLDEIQTKIVTSPPINFEGKSLEIDKPFESDLKNVDFEYQLASERTLNIVHFSAEGKISSQGSTVTGSGETFERLGIGDAIIIRNSLDEIQTKIVTSPPINFKGKSLEINKPFDSDLKNVDFEYQLASERTLDIVRFVDRDQTIQFLVNAEGKVGFGTSTPHNQLDVLGAVAIGQAYAGETKVPDNGLLVDGKVGLGTSTPHNQLDVLGAVAIGQAYAGETKAPDNGLLVDGTVSIGSTLPSDATNFKLYVNGNIKGNSITAKSGIFCSQEGANLSFQTGDTTRISVAGSTGNVGIGLTTPAQQLLIVENGQVGIGYNQSDQSATLAVNGNVGIGTPRPEAQLHVVGTVQVETAQDAIALGLLHGNQSVNISFQDSRLQFIAKGGLKGYSFDQALKATELEGNSLKLREGATIEVFSTDSNLLHNRKDASDKAVPTEKAVRTYIDRKIGEVQATLTDKADRAEIETKINKLRGELQIYVDEAISKVQSTLESKAKRNGDTNEDFTAKKLNVETSIYSKVVATETINSQTVASVKAVSNGFYQVSSRALKKEINDLSSQEVATILRSLNPVKFIYTEDESKTPQAGFIAEDTPDLLTANDKQAIKVVDIVAILTKVAQDHRKTLSDMVKIVKKQQAEIAALTQKIKEMEEKTDP